MTAVLITEPAVEPVSIGELKAHLRIENADEDSLISDLLKSARRFLETNIDVKLISQSWRVYFDEVPYHKWLSLPLSPMQSVTGIIAYDQSGTPSTIDPADYSVDAVSPVPRIQLQNIDAKLRCFNGIEIDLVAGFGDLPLDVPDGLRRAVMLLAAHWFEFRHTFSATQQPVSIPPGYSALVAPFRRQHL